MLPIPYVEQPAYEAAAFAPKVEMSASVPAADVCTSSRAEEVAQKARDAFPILPDTVGGQMPRFKFIHENRWALFDPSGEGEIDLEAYIDYAWSTMLAYAPSGKCVVTLDDYLALFVGSPKVVALQEVNAPWFVTADKTNFHMLDRGHKGYITREDMRATFVHDFKKLDKDRDGKLTLQEFQ